MEIILNKAPATMELVIAASFFILPVRAHRHLRRQSTEQWLSRFFMGVSVIRRVHPGLPHGHPAHLHFFREVSAGCPPSVADQTSPRISAAPG
jgi:uncharacterized protein (DUF2236 family)